GLKFELCEREGVKYFVLVYPDERMVKVFELLGGRYEEKRDKVFTFGKCELSIDFPKAFERLR
ncbi:MAG: Uma2 family endonuclease, partial [Aquificaceae bacterium]